MLDSSLGSPSVLQQHWSSAPVQQLHPLPCSPASPLARARSAADFRDSLGQQDMDNSPVSTDFKEFLACLQDYQSQKKTGSGNLYNGTSIGWLNRQIKMVEQRRVACEQQRAWITEFRQDFEAEALGDRSHADQVPTMREHKEDSPSKLENEQLLSGLPIRGRLTVLEEETQSEVKKHASNTAVKAVSKVPSDMKLNLASVPPVSPATINSRQSSATQTGEDKALRALQAELLSSNKERRALQAQLAELDAKHTNLHKSWASLEATHKSKLADLEKQHSALQSSHTSLQAECEAAKKQHSLLESGGHLQQRTARLERELTESRAKVLSLQARAGRALSASKDSYAADLSDIHYQQITELRQQLADARTMETDYARRYHTMRAKITDLEKDMSSTQQRAAELVRREQEYIKSNRELVQEVKGLSHALEEAQAQGAPKPDAQVTRNIDVERKLDESNTLVSDLERKLEAEQAGRRVIVPYHAHAPVQRARIADLEQRLLESEQQLRESEFAIQTLTSPGNSQANQILSLECNLDNALGENEILRSRVSELEVRVQSSHGARAAHTDERLTFQRHIADLHRQHTQICEQREQELNDAHAEGRKHSERCFEQSQRIETLEAEQELLEGKLGELQRLNGAQSGDVKQHLQRIVDLEHQLKARDAQIFQKDTQLNDLQNLNNKQGGTVKQYMQRIVDLENQLKSRDEQISNKSVHLSQLETLNDAQSGTVKQHLQRIVELERQLESRDNQISEEAAVQMQLRDSLSEANEQSGDVNEHLQRIADLEHQLKVRQLRDPENEANERGVKEHSQRIADLEHQLKVRDEQISTKVIHISHLETRFDAQNGTVKQHLQRIAELERQLGSRDNQISEEAAVQRQLRDSQNAANEQSGDVNEHLQRIADLEHQLKARDFHLAETEARERQLCEAQQRTLEHLEERAHLQKQEQHNQLQSSLDLPSEFAESRISDLELELRDARASEEEHRSLHSELRERLQSSESHTFADLQQKYNSARTNEEKKTRETLGHKQRIRELEEQLADPRIRFLTLDSVRLDSTDPDEATQGRAPGPKREPANAAADKHVRVEKTCATLRSALSEKARSGQLKRILSARGPALSQDRGVRPTLPAEVETLAPLTNSSNKDEAHFERVRAALRRSLAEKASTPELQVILARRFSTN